MRRIIQRYNEGTTNGRVTQLPSPGYDNRGTVGPPAYPVGRDFGPYMPDQLPSDFQPGLQQQDTGSNATSGGYNSIDLQGFVDNNFVYNNSAANNSAANNSGTTLYPSVGPLGANPMVSTGIPQGGHAKQAIADYLAGKTLGDPLSYVAGKSNVPDYHALADALGTSVIDAYRPAASAAVGDNNTAHEEMMGTDYVGTDLYPGSSLTYDQVNELSDLVVPDGSYNPSTDTLTEDQITYVEDYSTSLDNDVNTNDYANDPRIAQEDLAMGNIGNGSGSGSLVTGSSSDRSMIDDLMDRSMSDVISNQVDEYAKSGKVFNADDPSTWVQTNDSGARGSDFFTPGATFAGGGTDNQGNFGLIGDIGGDLAEALGIVPEDYDWGANELDGLAGFGQAGVTQSNTAAPAAVTSGPFSPGGIFDPNHTPSPNPNQAAADAHAATQGSSRGGERAEQAQAAIDARLKADAIARYGSEQAWLNATDGGRWYNNGGPIGYRVQTYNNGSSGGVTTAKSGIREEEIRERQRMQSRLPQVQQQQGPLSDIGSKLAMGAIDTGIDTGIATLAGKEGLAGTLGTMMGSGGGAAAGTGMMASLGPIGIGLGLGKLFGLFNKGGEVTCSCGKPNCNCLSKMKYSL